MGSELVEELSKIVTREFPLERLCHGLVVSLKGEQALFDRGQRREVVGGKDLALDDGEVDFDLVEPAGMNGTMDRNEARIFRLESGHAARSAMRGAIVHNPEDPASLVVGWLVHDVADQSLERRDAGLAFTAAKHFGAVDVEGRQVGPRAATDVFVLDAHGHARLRWQRRVYTRPRLDAGLLIGGQHELVIAQQLLLDHADRFRAGIIVSSGARLRVLPSLFDMLAHDFPAYVEMVDRLGFSEKTAAAVKLPFLEERRKARPEVAHGDLKACDRFDVIARLASIRVPVLVISAADDSLTPPKYAEFLAQHIPASRRVHIPDAGHFVPIEKPQAVNAAIAEFLDGNYPGKID